MPLYVTPSVLETTKDFLCYPWYCCAVTCFKVCCHHNCQCMSLLNKLKKIHMLAVKFTNKRKHYDFFKMCSISMRRNRTRIQTRSKNLFTIHSCYFGLNCHVKGTIHMSVKHEKKGHDDPKEGRSFLKVLSVMYKYLSYMVLIVSILASYCICQILCLVCKNCSYRSTCQ